MCKNCEKYPVYEFTNKRKLCKDCFIKYFQKKVLYTIRKFRLIKKDEVVSYNLKRDFRDVVLKDVLEMFACKAPIKLIKNSKKGADKLAVVSTVDSEAKEIMECVIEGDLKKLKVNPIEGKIIKPLYLFLDEEVLLYAKLKGLSFKAPAQKENKISRFINELEKKHPEVKRAIVNGWLESVG